MHQELSLVNYFVEVEIFFHFYFYRKKDNVLNSPLLK